MMEKIDNISPALADMVMNAGYQAIDVLYSKVSCFSFGNSWNLDQMPSS